MSNNIAVVGPLETQWKCAGKVRDIVAFSIKVDLVQNQRHFFTTTSPPLTGLIIDFVYEAQLNALFADQHPIEQSIPVLRIQLRPSPRIQFDECSFNLRVTASLS